MIKTWEDLTFWETGEWQVIEEKLDALKDQVNPKRELLFAALDATPYSSVRVVIIGQDPYPENYMATGLAFSIPKEAKKVPPTLQNILREYQSDLGLPDPGHGDLSSWTEQGVLLWNAIPSCEESKPGSHKDWYEWDLLTEEIVRACSDKGVVFGLLGSYARAYKKFIDTDANGIVETAHPSPLAVNNKNTNNPFLGSRFFSTINANLCEMKLEPVDWRLP